MEGNIEKGMNTAEEVERKNDIAFGSTIYNFLKVAIAGAMIQHGFSLHSEHKEAERMEENYKITTALNSGSEVIDDEAEHIIAEKYDQLLKEYYSCLEKGENPSKECLKARALEIAIKSGVVSPQKNGLSFLWENIKFVAQESCAPIHISFGNTQVFFSESYYQPKELEQMKKILDEESRQKQEQEQKREDRESGLHNLLNRPF